jgi:hypothetical protein
MSARLLFVWRRLLPLSISFLFNLAFLFLTGLSSVNLAAAQNVPPSVQITAPGNNSVFIVGRSIFLAANAQDTDGSVQRVEFYDGTTLIGTDTTAPYIIGWNYPFGGVHSVTARAFDNSGASATSAPVAVGFDPPASGPIPLGFGPPTVTSPTNGTVFNTFSNLTISATVGGGSYVTSRVEFYLNTTLIGTDSQFPFSVEVNNIPTGNYSVFAKTIATSGAQEISPPVDITVRQPPRTPFDFDGDGVADIGVYRGGAWYLQMSTGRFIAKQFGVASDKIVPADFDGDGKTDLAVFREGTWYYLQSSDNDFRAVQFGAAGDVPQAGDFDGDEKSDFAVFRPLDGTWYLLRSNAGFTGVQFGQNGDKPVANDYDGDGKFDLAVYRAGGWFVQQSRDGFRAIQFGLATDKPTPADYDGDHKADFAVYRDGAWYLQRSQAGFTAVQFGVASDVPTPADYDGDGKSDLAVFRNGVWYLLQSTAGFNGFQFGAANDVPVPSAYVP